MAARKKNVFISHVHEDDAEVQNLKRLLATKGYEVRDSSIDSSKPNNATDHDYIKREILAPRIDWAGTVIVLISSHTHKSEWVDWEIKYANRADKQIVGVCVQGATEANLPDELELANAVVVGWQADRVIDAIEGRITDRYSPDGTCAPRPLARYSC